MFLSIIFYIFAVNAQETIECGSTSCQLGQYCIQSGDYAGCYDDNCTTTHPYISTDYNDNAFCLEECE